MKSITVNAPAKINLMLDVTGKRPDGYHELVTVMQSISLSDTVFIEVNNNGKIAFECKADHIPDGKENIAYRAAETFLEQTGVSCGGLYIKVDKHIPFQAGLGGGSADCAAVLTGLNKLLGINYPIGKLCEIGVNLGADVPFCLVGGTKLCSGIGEDISTAPPLEDCFIVIGKGRNGISTKKAYEKIDLLDLSENLKASLYDGTLSSLSKTGGNIFENVTDNNDVSEIKKICTEFGAVYSAMSGSGSAVFGLYRSQHDAKSCFSCLKERKFFSEVCKPLPHGAKLLKIF